MTVRVAVVGAGWWATTAHIPALAANPKAEVTVLVDPDSAKRQRAQDHFGIARGAAGIDEVLDEVDAVVIATPHAQHYAPARAALDAGVHVLVEKPMTVDPDEAWDLVARAEQAGAHLLVGYTFNFTHLARVAREAVASGLLGDLHLVSCLYASMAESFLAGRPGDYAGIAPYAVAQPESTTYSDPRTGGGQALTQVTHAMGMLLHVVQRDVTSVQARMRSFGLAVDLADAAVLELSGGALATVGSVGSLAPGQQQHQELRCFGSGGNLVFDFGLGTLGLNPKAGAVSVEQLTPDERYPAAAPSTRLVELALGATDDNPASGVLGAQVVECLAAMHQSAKVGAPVELRTAPASPDPGGPG